MYIFTVYAIYNSSKTLVIVIFVSKLNRLIYLQKK